MNFQTVAIKDIGQLFDGPHATPPLANEGAIFLGIKNISEDGHLNFSEIRYVSERDFPLWIRRVTPQKGDIVFTYEATLHRYAIIPEGFRGCLGRRVALLRPKPDSVDSYYLFYYFRSPIWKAKVEANILVGATVDRVPIGRFPDFTLNLPPLVTQQRIAEILSNYDSLIDNNNRRIALLEESIHKLYKEWFVHLRFPGYESVKVVDGIPEGWNMGYLPNLCSKLMDGTHDSPKPTDDGYYLVTGKHIVNGFIDFSKCYFISPEEHQKVMKRSHPEKGDIIFSNIGTLGSIALVDQEFEFSIKNVALFKPLKKLYSSFLYIHLSDVNTLTSMSQKASGTSQKFFSLKFLRNSDILIPPDEIIIQFDNFARPILEQRSLLNKNNQKLKEARDLLLPRLINGSIAV